MPRLGGGNASQSYLVALSDGKSLDSAARNNQNNMTILRTSSVDGATTSGIGSRTPLNPPPSSADSLSRSSMSLIQSRPSSTFVSNSPSTLQILEGGSTSAAASPALSPPRSRTVQELPTIASDVAPRKPSRKTILRAAETGTGNLLPDYTPTTVTRKPVRRRPPDRLRTRSSPSLKAIMLGGGGSASSTGKHHQKGPILPQTQQDTVTPKSSMSMSLRRRTNASASDDDDYSTPGRLEGRRGRRYGSPYSNNGDYYNDIERRRGSSRRSSSTWQTLSRIKLGHMLQLVIVLAVTALVWESHHKALFAAQRLSQFKEEESLLLLHLQRIEQQSIQLHENLARLAQSDKNSNSNGGAVSGRAESTNSDAGQSLTKDTGTVDYDLILKQTNQLKDMEEELNHELRTLQKEIQKTARNHIIQEFGEGPVQVVLEVDFSNDPTEKQHRNNKISILLWHKTPHAAWVWLEQIGRHIWDGAEFQWQGGQVIDALPAVDDTSGGGKIEFVEQSPRAHQPWTVGVRETETGAMSFFINLKDNSNLNKHETCVGEVIDGFDTLEQLLVLSKRRRYENSPSIPIKSVVAMHVTKKEGVA